MKQIEGFKLRPLGKEFIITGEGAAQVNFNKMISLNATAAYLWECVQDKEFTVEDLKAALLDRYEVDEETAGKDAEAIAEKWIKVGIVSR